MIMIDVPEKFKDEQARLAESEPARYWSPYYPIWLELKKDFDRRVKEHRGANA